MGTRRSGLAVLLTLLGGLLVAGAAEAQEELFVANVNTNSITVYSRTAGGNIAPLRTLSGATTGLSNPDGLAVDLTNNELVVANFTNSSVTVYSRTASGNTAPLRTLGGPATGLGSPRGLALDLTNNELVVVNGGGSVTVYSRTASGNTAPSAPSVARRRGWVTSSASPSTSRTMS
jgi:6-phosphogluconolactonase (cycloisomerase 2 family)